MTIFTYEIEATTEGSIVNLGEAPTLEEAFAIVEGQNLSKRTLITIQKLEVTTSRRGGRNFAHHKTYEYETV